MVQIHISFSYFDIGPDKASYTLMGGDEEVTFRIFEQKPLNIKILYKEDAFVTSIDFKENKLDKEQEFILWVKERLDVSTNSIISNLKTCLFKAPKSYIDSLSTKTQCRKLLDIYHILIDSAVYEKFKHIFESHAIYHIVLMHLLRLSVEDNIQDNYIKIYNHIITRVLYRQNDTYATLTDKIRLRFIRYIPSGCEDFNYDPASNKRSYSPLYIVKQRFILARLQATSNSFYDRENELVLTPTGGDSINPIIGCIVEDYSGCPFVQFHFTPISMYNLDPYPKQ